MKNKIFKYSNKNESFGFLLFRLNEIWKFKLEEVFRKYEVTQTQYAILASIVWLKHSEGKPIVTQNDLVTHTKIEKMTLSKAIRSLEKNRWLTRFCSENDSRTFDIKITKDKFEIICNLIKEVENCDELFAERLSKSNQQEFKKMILALIQ